MKINFELKKKLADAIFKSFVVLNFEWGYVAGVTINFNDVDNRMEVLHQTSLRYPFPSGKDVVDQEFRISYTLTKENTKPEGEIAKFCDKLVRISLEKQRVDVEYWRESEENGIQDT